jgi:hypothetical protein
MQQIPDMEVDKAFFAEELPSEAVIASQCQL